MTEKTAYLTANDLKKSATRRYHEFDVDISGDVTKVRIQSLSEKEKSDFETAIDRARGKAKIDRTKDFKRRLITACVVDGDGSRVFGQSDVMSLESADGRLTSRIFNECIDHVGFTKDDVEELEKN